MERRKIKNFSFLISISILFLLYLLLNAPVNNQNEIILEVKSGDTFYNIANYLKQNKIIKSKKFFLLNVLILQKSKKLQRGVYNIKDSYSTLKIIKILTEGKIYQKVITIPEGFNMFQIAELLEKEKIISKEEFVKACKNPEILKKYKIDSQTAEGFLFPDTYYIPFNPDSNSIVEIMIKNFFQKVNELYLKRMKEKNYTLKEMVTLASLVEWEAASDFERPIIASVFLNRLKKNLNLASCATVLYALGNHKNRLLFKDLKKDSPYNTYIYKGLPPTPICNPSLNSILAVLYPAKTDYLYFVSMGNKRHYFSKTYSEHLNAYKKFVLQE